MTNSRIAFETPKYWGISLSSSITLLETVVLSPCGDCMNRLPSSVFCFGGPVFCTVSCRFLVTTMVAPLVDLNCSLTWARTSFSPHSCVFGQQSLYYDVVGIKFLYLGIMNERSAFGVWRLVAGCCILEGLDDGLAYTQYGKYTLHVDAHSFSRAIISDY